MVQKPQVYILWVDGQKVVKFNSGKVAAEEFKARHAPELQARMEILPEGEKPKRRPRRVL